MLISSLLGLYAPREGQAYRERQRRQFSQFDRGTSLAQSELAAVSNQLPYPTFRDVSQFRPGDDFINSSRFDATVTGVRKHITSSIQLAQHARSFHPGNSKKFYGQAHYKPQPFQQFNL